MALIEPELLIVQRAFPEAQRLLAGVVTESVAVAEEVGWHDTEVSSLMGAAAAVRQGGPYEALIGEVIEVTYAKTIYVYVSGRADVVTDLSLARRAFRELAPLGLVRITVSIGVVG